MEKLEKIFETVNKLTIQIEKLATETMYLRKDQNELVNRVTTLEKKPEKRYDTIVTTIITGIISAVVGAVMAIVIKK